MEKIENYLSEGKLHPDDDVCLEIPKGDGGTEIVATDLDLKLYTGTASERYVILRTHRERATTSEG